MNKDMENPNAYTTSLIERVRNVGAGLYADSLNTMPFCFSGDGLNVVGRNMGFLTDDQFVSAFKFALDRFEVPELRGVLESIIWRKHISCSLASQVIGIDGDFVECGVEWGFGVDVVSRFLDFSNIDKKWFLYDTYTGVPDEHKDEGFVVSDLVTKSSQFEKVKQKFSCVENIVPVQGKLPEILREQCPEKIAFLHIDLNNAIAEIETFTALYPKVSVGGVILFDDYGALLFAKQHVVEREYIRKLGLTITELPTGQALLIKSKELDFSLDPQDELETYQFKNHVRRMESYACQFSEIERAGLNDVLGAYEYFKRQLRYISECSKACTDSELSKNLQGVCNKFSSVSFESRDDGYKYTTLIEYELIKLGEIRFDLQRKIDYLQGVIDYKCVGAV
ncbi:MULTISPECIES: TylF/MycF/NovP-related O-methyltransferase [unclassified Pseudomonas]|uniref:TylF/MycF/NovP-related O-methyltransferase n=1 Tax=unclassified Pseudomonas TaxID=196821 RepID=UPI0024478574|nr:MULTISPECIES: TylF/MycF/NovP-related O-methyltransferase [unclassified Pseudomonas]MDG9925379.1 TylF/MycF family methyltransferase [Pseudomonas sp. GD04045]MDH0037281.1 TylF/MycF family methyltransferase [Pseudomonas sp. GD04019]